MLLCLRPLFFACVSAIFAQPALAAPEQLVLSIGGEPEQGFDPLLGWGGYGNPLFQSTLLRRGPALETEPDLAVDWQLSSDRLVWTITLRDDVLFSDGTALTAKDVAFTFNAAKAAAGGLDLAAMKAATALDDRRLRITLERPWITFAESFFTLGIVPAASYGPGYGRAPLGSGPYKMVSWQEGAQLIVEANPYYYGAKSQFPRVTFLFTAEEAGLAAAQSGIAHLAALPAPLADTKAQGYHRVRVATVDSRGLSLPFPAPAVQDGQEVGHAVTSDLAIRKAINLGLARDLLVEAALHGHGTPAAGPVDGLPWSGETAPPRYDLAAAKALLDAAGWHEASDGIRQKGDVRAAFPIHYPAGDASRQALAETTAALLQPLGIEATARGGSWQAIAGLMHKEPVIFGFGSHSPYQIYSLYAAELAGQAWSNPSYYANPKVDALFAAAQSAESFDAAIPFWAAAAAEYGLAGDNAWAWLANLDHNYLVHDCLDLGPLQIEPHGHGWPITTGITHWRWTCD